MAVINIWVVFETTRLSVIMRQWGKIEKKGGLRAEPWSFPFVGIKERRRI